MTRPLGFKHSEETKNKMSKSALGRKFSSEHIKNLRLSHLGVKHTEERKKLMNYSRRGSENHSWKGGITPLVYQIRNCFKTRQWRSDIFARDDYTCVLCGIRGVYIEADHYPVRFSIIFEQSKVKTLEEAENYEQFWNINNGRTLCKKCHLKFNKRNNYIKK